MTLRIVAVNAKVPKTAALLTFLQLSTLEHDEPYDVRDGHWWIAYEGELAVGYAGLVNSSRWSDTGYLCRSGVITSHRGKGLQKRFLRVRETKAKKLGMAWLISDTCSNPASSNSLISCGFKIFAPSKPWGLVSAIYWRKRICERHQIA